MQEKLAGLPLPFEPKPGEFIFCHVGRYHADKNQALLLQAFALLKGRPCRLLLVGRGVPTALQELVQSLGLSTQVLLS
jgi:glycosyltransferase involved in cell wall biosynthesis